MFSLFSTVYIVAAVVLLEEPKLVEEYGDQYIKYMKRVPRFVPGLWII